MLGRRFWVMAGLVATFAMPWRGTDSGAHALDPELPGALERVPVPGMESRREVPALHWLLEWSSPAVASANASWQPVRQDSVANDSAVRER